MLHRPLDPINTLGETHAAGAAFVVAALLTCALCSAVMANRSRRHAPVVGGAAARAGRAQRALAGR